MKYNDFKQEAFQRIHNTLSNMNVRLLEDGFVPTTDEEKETVSRLNYKTETPNHPTLINDHITVNSKEEGGIRMALPLSNLYSSFVNAGWNGVDAFVQFALGLAKENSRQSAIS